MFDWKAWIDFGIAVGVALIVALAVVVVTALITGAAARRRDWAKALGSRARHPYRLLITVIALWIAVTAALPPTRWDSAIHHGLLILTIAVVTWFVSAIISFALTLAMVRYRTDVPDNRAARRAQTQILIVRRLVVVVLVIIGIASVLLTFPGVQAVGASVLASAGVLSVVAGLAAQSTLSNIFAGLQLAFSDAIRVDDVVVVQTQWGRIEEITLTYVVVHLWDDRRFVLPSTWFTQNPFENWTRHSSQLLGSVEFDLDWRVSPSLMREELDRILADTDLWDRRTSVLQVTDAVGGWVHVRVLATAKDAPTLFDLRCYIRERLVEWLHDEDPAALPRTRVQMVEQPARVRRKGDPSADQSGLFTGSEEAEERANQFTTSIPIVEEESPSE